MVPATIFMSGGVQNLPKVDDIICARSLRPYWAPLGSFRPWLCLASFSSIDPVWSHLTSKICLQNISEYILLLTQLCINVVLVIDLGLSNQVKTVFLQAYYLKSNKSKNIPRQLSIITEDYHQRPQYW